MLAAACRAGPACNGSIGIVDVMIGLVALLVMAVPLTKPRERRDDTEAHP